MISTRFSAAMVALFIFCSANLQASPPSEAVIIHAGWLIDVPGQEPKRRQSLLIEDGRIKAVVAGFVNAENFDLPGRADIIDLSDKYVLPGMIDCHVHIMQFITAQQQIDNVTLDDGDYAIRGAVNAYNTLAAGFTTVRDLGSPGNAVFALRDAIKSGLIPGPRIIAAGSIISATGGHGDHNGYRDDIGDLLTSSGICDGADSCRKAVRAQVKRGADVIKVTATGGVMSAVASGFGQQLTDDELTAIVEQAHRLGRKVAAHAIDSAGINAALSAGVDSIEHGTYSDAHSVKLFSEKQAYIVPTQMTIIAASQVADPENGFPEPLQDKARAFLPKLKTYLSGLHREDVKIAFGTDAGVYPHGQNGGEFGYLVKAGLTPSEALQTATVNAADLLGLSDEIGTLVTGKAADIIAVAGDPLEDISALHTVPFVMYGGKVFKHDR